MELGDWGTYLDDYNRLRTINHTVVEQVCDRIMDENGYRRLKLSCSIPYCEPDRLYEGPGGRVLFEIKPPNITKAEVYKGIGQVIANSLYKAKSYLVIYKKTWQVYEPLLKIIPAGIAVYEFTYTSSPTLEFIKHPEITGVIALLIEK